MQFSIGFISIGLAITLPVLYFFIRKIRMFEHWRTNSKESLERPAPTAIIISIIGIIAGGLVQPHWDSVSYCVDSGHLLAKCLTQGL